MDQQFIPAAAKTPLEDIQQRFKKWREGRKRSTPIPEGLWGGAVELCSDHSIYKISQSLRLDYNALKRRVHSSHPEHFCESAPSSAFVELDLQMSQSKAECLVEMESRDGAKLKLHILGGPCLDPLEFMKAFLGLGR